MKFTPSEVSGVVAAQPSKSAAHRALILAYLAGDATVSPLVMSDDILATIGCLTALGATVALNGGVAHITRGKLPKEVTLDVKESGTTLRFFMPLVSALGVTATFCGAGRLGARPYQELAQQLVLHGAKFSCLSGLPVTISGKLRAGQYTLAGNVSSQYISGLLLALPLLEGESSVTICGKLESKSYVDMTLAMLKRCKIKVEETPSGYRVLGFGNYQTKKIVVEGDYSNAAFFLVAGALCGNVTVSGLDPCSTQGDRKIIEILLQMGAQIIMFGNRIQAKQSKLHAIDIDVSAVPDLAPVLAVLLGAAEGTGKLTNAARLRLKECDRFQAVLSHLKCAGISARAMGDDIEIVGGTPVACSVDGFSDHRMVMAAAILGLRVAVEVQDSAAVSKSYPTFFEDYRAIGGKADD